MVSSFPFFMTQKFAHTGAKITQVFLRCLIHLQHIVYEAGSQVGKIELFTFNSKILLHLSCHKNSTKCCPNFSCSYAHEISSSVTIGPPGALSILCPCLHWGWQGLTPIPHTSCFVAPSLDCCRCLPSHLHCIKDT